MRKLALDIPSHPNGLVFYFKNDEYNLNYLVEDIADITIMYLYENLNKKSIVFSKSHLSINMY